MRALVVNCSPVSTGATAEICRLVARELESDFKVRSICIDAYVFGFCKGCRSCLETGECVQRDDVAEIMEEYDRADVIVTVSPSYWGDVPGQFKAFIDRCTPWCNTHEPHASLHPGKCGYSIALRAGSSMKECNRIMDTIEHFYGHLEIKGCGRLGLCKVECKQDVALRSGEISAFCQRITEENNAEIRQIEELYNDRTPA